MKLEITENQAKQFLAITESAHMDWEPFVVIRDQINAAFAPVEVPVAAVAAFMAGVPHEQFDEEVEETIEPEVISKKK
jgi:hypothetical protein